jgi:hypothetical protein
MTPEQEEQVRRALAAAARAEDHDARASDRRGPGPVDGTDPSDPSDLTDPTRTGDHRSPPLPADVAARLDSVLEELVAPRVTSTAPSEADELARRRRRRWPNGLVAAAALCAIALAGGAVATGGFGLSNGSGSDSQTAASTASDAGAGSESGSGSGSRSAAGPSAPGVASPGADSAAPSDQPRELAATGSSPTFRTETLTSDLQRLVDRPGPLPIGEQPSWRCVAPSLGAGEQLIGVRIDGRRSSLVLGAPSEGQRSARFYSCADPSILVATTTVRTPRP